MPSPTDVLLSNRRAMFIIRTVAWHRLVMRGDNGILSNAPQIRDSMREKIVVHGIEVFPESRCLGSHEEERMFRLRNTMMR